MCFCLTVGALLKASRRPRLSRAWPVRPIRSFPCVPGKYFHPKIALLVGKKHIRVFVGSHNMTLAGFGHNRELSTEVDLPRGKDDSKAAFAQDVWNFLEAWLQHQAAYIPQSIHDAALRVATFAPWLEKEHYKRVIYDSLAPTQPAKACGTVFARCCRRASAR